MKENIKYILEQIVKLIIVFVVILLIIGSVTVAKRFFSEIKSNVEPIPDYEMHEPEYNKEQIKIYME